MRRVMIAGTGSGCGKTTVTCAILQALKSRNIAVSSFKCGPDYIDPMFHRTVIGTDAHNLDSFFCGQDALCSLLGTYAGEISVIEGVMGFFDGGNSSSFSVSSLTETPVILVLNCRGMSDSIGAVMQGFLRYREPNHIVGFIFNRLPEKLIPLAKSLCQSLGTGYFGCFPACHVTIESRHLGLVTADEISDIQAKMQYIGELAEQFIQLDALLALPDLPLPCCHVPEVLPVTQCKPVIAVAQDRAFCFTYAENLRVLSQLGCEILAFSPISDAQLPACDGLYLPGGYPELYAEPLSENRSMRDSIAAAIRTGMPTIAECGGFLYLHKSLTNADGVTFPMVGIYPGNAYPTKKLQRFGYITMTSGTDNLLCAAGGQMTAHEFHYWESTAPGTSFHAEKQDGRSWDCAHANAHIYAGFPHLYWYADTRPAQRFTLACVAFKEEQHGRITETAAG